MNEPLTNPGDQGMELLSILDKVVQDRHTSHISTDLGGAALIPMEHYIRLLKIEDSLRVVLSHASVGNVQGIVDTVEGISIWLLEGGGERYVIEDHELPLGGM